MFAPIRRFFRISILFFASMILPLFSVQSAQATPCFLLHNEIKINTYGSTEFPFSHLIAGAKTTIYHYRWTPLVTRSGEFATYAITLPRKDGGTSELVWSHDKDGKPNGVNIPSSGPRDLPVSAFIVGSLENQASVFLHKREANLAKTLFRIPAHSIIEAPPFDLNNRTRTLNQSQAVGQALPYFLKTDLSRPSLLSLQLPDGGKWRTLGSGMSLVGVSSLNPEMLMRVHEPALFRPSDPTGPQYSRRIDGSIRSTKKQKKLVPFGEIIALTQAWGMTRKADTSTRELTVALHVTGAVSITDFKQNLMYYGGNLLLENKNAIRKWSSQARLEFFGENLFLASFLSSDGQIRHIPFSVEMHNEFIPFNEHSIRGTYTETDWKIIPGQLLEGVGRFIMRGAPKPFDYASNRIATFWDGKTVRVIKLTQAGPSQVLAYQTVPDSALQQAGQNGVLLPSPIWGQFVLIH